MNLKQRWKALLENAGIDTKKAKNDFQVLRSHYRESHRRYHTLDHIEAMLGLMDEYRNVIEKPIPFELGIWFHDVIYQPSGVDNEEESALLAERLMREWNLDPETIHLATEYIRSTSGHFPRIDSFDCNLFLDFDLAILGSEEKMYEKYQRGIRKEYDIYNDEFYYPARKKVLNAFLTRERIFFTDLMHQRFESTARANIKKETGV